MWSWESLCRDTEPWSSFLPSWVRNWWVTWPAPSAVTKCAWNSSEARPTSSQMTMNDSVDRQEFSRKSWDVASGWSLPLLVVHRAARAPRLRPESASVSLTGADWLAWGTPLSPAQGPRPTLLTAATCTS